MIKMYIRMLHYLLNSSYRYPYLRNKFLRIIRQTIVDEGDLLGGTGRSCHAHRKQSVRLPLP